MRPHNLSFDVGRTMRVAAVAIGMIALVVPNSDTASADDTKKGRRQGTTAANADARLGIFGILFASTGPGLTGSGVNAYAAGPAPHTTAPGSVVGGDRGIASTFESLSRQQQARVMQRCKDILAAPAQADVNQVSLCETLSWIAGH